MQPNEAFINENVTSMMLNDLNTMCLVKKMNLVTTHHRFIANITSTIAQFLQAYFHNHDATCEILGNQ